MKRIAKYATCSVVALATVLGLASCSSGGSGSTSGDSGATQISVGNFPNTILTLPLGVAEGQKFFQDEKLSVKIVPGNTGPGLLSAMIGGTTQITPAPTTVAIAAMSQGQELKIFAPFEQANTVIAVRSDSGIKDVTGLVGKRVGVDSRGGASELLASALLKEVGADPSKVIFVATGTPATMGAALANGKVDAMVGSNATEAILAQTTKLTVIASSLDGTFGERGKQSLASFYVTTPKYYSEHAGTVNAFCRAVTRAASWIADDSNQNKVLQYIGSWTGLKDQGAVKMIYDSVHKSWVSTLSEDRWNANVEYTAGSKQIPYSNVMNGCG